MAVSSNTDDILIAGRRSRKHWRSFGKGLAPGGDPDLWRRAACDYFHTRVATRYLDPIAAIMKLKRNQGEGFSIVAIQCSMIEFLESTVQGVSYCYRPWGSATQLSAHEYSDSQLLFVDFLRKREPFKEDFKTKRIAQDFYVGVRCGLLHEAKTKNAWLIQANGPAVIGLQPKKILYRNNFQKALEEFIRSYETDLESNTHLQEAFIRKFDSLCQ
jgi:hypothetical protein